MSNIDYTEFDETHAEQQVSALLGQLGDLCEKHGIPFVATVMYARKLTDDEVTVSYESAKLLPKNRTPDEYFTISALLQQNYEAALGGVYGLIDRGGNVTTTDVK